ncbi:MAG TPA: hypothetical protein VIG33_06000 [Pseudobdellovibrionaceae bacterium]|jgi:hypothetical protein
MTAALNIQKVQRAPSIEMKAVLEILNADSFLMESVMPFIDFQNENIYWDQIFKNSFGSGHRGALLFAYAIWTDEVRSNPFDAAFSMGPKLQIAVLKAMALRWGLQ